MLSTFLRFSHFLLVGFIYQSTWLVSGGSTGLSPDTRSMFLLLFFLLFFLGVPMCVCVSAWMWMFSWFFYRDANSACFDVPLEHLSNQSVMVKFLCENPEYIVMTRETSKEQITPHHSSALRDLSTILISISGSYFLARSAWCALRKTSRRHSPEG